MVSPGKNLQMVDFPHLCSFTLWYHDVSCVIVLFAKHFPVERARAQLHDDLWISAHLARKARQATAIAGE